MKDEGAVIFVVLCLLAAFALFFVWSSDIDNPISKCYIYPESYEVVSKHFGGKYDYCYNTQTQQYLYCEPIEMECK